MMFQEEYSEKFQTHHQALAINIHYGSENTYSSEFKEVKGNDSFRLEPLMLKLLIASTSTQ